MRGEHQILNLTVTANSAVQAGQIVDAKGNLADGTIDILGVAQANTAAGDPMTVTVIGVCNVTTTNEVKTGDPVNVTAGGKVVKATDANQIGLALSDANPNQTVSILIR